MVGAIEAEGLADGDLGVAWLLSNAELGFELMVVGAEG